MNAPIAIGQRWRYQSGGLDFIMEVQAERVVGIYDGSVKGLVIQGNYTPGSIHTFNPFPDSTSGDGRWSYLHGQDKPKS